MSVVRLIDAHILMEELQKGTANAIKPDFQKGLLEAQRLVINSPTVNDKAYAIGYAAGSREGYRKGIEDARPTGKWIDNQDNIGGGINCSICGKMLPCSDEYWYEANYCPNCGARMEVTA